MLDDIFHLDEDPYGAGSDLMISLFAVSMLLLSIMGAGDQLDRTQQDATARAVAPPAQPAGATTGVPPLHLASTRELAEVRGSLEKTEQERQRLLQQAETLAREAQRQQALLAGREEIIASMRAALNEASGKLQSLRAQKPDGRLDLARLAVGAGTLSGFVADHSDIVVELDPALRAALARKIAPFPPGANQVFIETAVPPGLLAFVPSTASGTQAMSAVYRVSAALADGYQQAFARAGLPLGCMTLQVRGFESSAEFRRAVTIDATDAPDAFAELVTLYRSQPRNEAAGEEATVSILLGTDAERPCDPASLEKSLATISHP